MGSGLDKQDLVDLFRHEAVEYLTLLNDGLTELQQGDPAPAVLERLFRVAHTLKGSAGLVGLDEVSTVAHRMEELLGGVQRGLVEADSCGQLLFRGLDLIEGLLETDGGGAGHAVAAFVGDVATYLAGSTPATSPQPVQEACYQVTAALGSTQAVGPRSGHGRSVRESRYTRVATEELDQMQGLTAEVVIGRHRIDRAIAEYRALWQELERLQERLSGVVDGLQMAAVGRVGAVQAGQHDDLPRDHRGGLGAELTRLVAALKSNFSLLRDQATSLARTTDGLQDQVCRARMVELGGLFQRFHKLVREAGQESGRECHLEIRGGETRLDKAVVERIFDPLIHLVRNAIAHGVESPEARVAAGKPRSGRILLSGQQQGDGVVIRISDDGAGIDPQRLRAAALARGLLSEAEAEGLSEEGMIELIFRPGFSTKEQVDGLAGRGVGMDVVRDAVVGLRGRITIQSTMGKGTTFLLRLPVSLAVTRGLFLRVDGVDLALPLSCVDGVASLTLDQLGEDGATVTFGDDQYPLHYLGPLLGLRGRSIADEIPVLLIAYDDQRLAIAVDALRGQKEMVLQPLSPYLERLRWFSATTVSASGTVRLVLDVGTLFAAVNHP